MSIERIPDWLTEPNQDVEGFLPDLYRGEHRNTIESYREEFTGEYYRMCAAHEMEVRRGVLMGIVNYSGHALYDDISPFVNRSDRVMRKEISELCEAGVLTKSEGKPTVVTFRTDGIELLARRILADFLDQH